jgi:heme-degrading monooxygenase HmoA
MIVRLTYVSFLPEQVEEARNSYNDEIMPVVKSQKGNLDCRLLEPIGKTEDYISMTVWDNKEDADAYQNSGVYRQLVEKLKKFYSKEPVLKIYSTQGIFEHA